MACDLVVQNLKTSLKSELDPVFESFESGVESLASLLDYTLSPWDSDAGHCLDFNTDPHVVVIIPQPVDYFSKCADTSLCHSLCASEWDAFQSANSSVAPMSTIEVNPTLSLLLP